MLGGKVKRTRKSPAKKRVSPKRKITRRRASPRRASPKRSSPKKETKQKPEWTKWSEVAPKTKAQRQQLIQICGSSCFLLPDQLKFPVCTSDCNVNCKGLIAARIRARQWNYPEVDKKVSEYYKEANCSKK